MFVLLAILSILLPISGFSPIYSQASAKSICGDVNGDGLVNVSDAVYIINYVFIPGWPPPCNGNVEDYALYFNGQSQWVTIPYRSELDLQEGFTIECWIYVVAHPSDFSDSKILIKEFSYDAAFCIDFKADYYRGFVNIGQRQCHFYTAVPIDQWHHIAYTYSPSAGGKLFLDGIEKASSDGEIPIPVEETNVYLGARPGWTPNSSFCGIIDELRIWNSVKSEDEIQTNMTTPLTGNEDGLILYYNFNEGIGQSIFDLTSNGIDAHLGALDIYDSSDPVWVESTVPLIH